MPTMFNTLELFSSGPHRVHVGPMGSQLVENAIASPAVPGRTAIGPLDGEVTIRGRLAAGSEADLWSLIEAVMGQITTPPTVADLTDAHEHTFKSMAFIALRLLGPFDRGRTVSVAYEAVFTRFGAWA